MKRTNSFTSDIIAIGIIIIVVIGTFMFVWATRNDPAHMRGSILNEGDEGTSLLFNWLGQQGYGTYSVLSFYDLTQPTNETIFILNSAGNYDPSELVKLESWIRSGGTAVIALESNQARTLTQLFSLNIDWTWPKINNAQLQLPVLNWPLVDDTKLQANHKIDIQCGRAAIHIGTCRRPILISFGHGSGQIYLISTVEPFTNQGLANRGNAQLVENLVRNSVKNNGTIAFDEGHRQEGLFWFLSNPAGRAFLLMLLLMLLLIVWQSLDLRPAKQEPIVAEPISEIQESVQYLNRVATAEKNMHGAKAVKTHYWQRLKRILAQKYGLDPTMPDEQLLVALQPIFDETDMALLISLRIRKDRDLNMDNIALRTWTESVIQLTEKYQPVTRPVYY